MSAHAWKDDPVNKVRWMPAEDLQSNDYNPNIVDTPEFRLLERSIYKTGWTQPVLVSRDLIIIDGFHRWTLSKESALLRKRYAGQLPVAVLDVGPDEAMAITVRMNRAKGTHQAELMHRLVVRLVAEYAWDEQQIAAEIGAGVDEVQLLLQDGIFKARGIPDWEYSRAWVPEETGSR